MAMSRALASSTSGLSASFDWTTNDTCSESRTTPTSISRKAPRQIPPTLGVNPIFSPLAATSSGEGVSPAANAAASGSPPGSAAAICTTLPGRRVGSFSRHRRITRSIAGSMSGTTLESVLGEDSSLNFTSSATESARYTGWPVNTSCSTRPSE